MTITGGMIRGTDPEAGSWARWLALMALLTAAVACWLLALGCAGGAAENAGVDYRELMAREAVGKPEGLPPKPEFPLPATATPWPTFTPLPPATAVPEPEGAGLSESENGEIGAETGPVLPTPLPTAAPAPLPEVAAVFRVSPVATVMPVPALPTVRRATPRPTRPAGELGTPDPEQEALRLAEYGRLPGLEVYLERQVLFPGSGPDLPQAIIDGDFSELGPSARRVPRRTRFVFWGVRWQPQPADLEFSFAGWVRFRGYHPDGRERFVQDLEVQEISQFQPYLVVGMGRTDAQVWLPGRYVAEFLDLATEEVVVDWEFEVYG